MLKSSSVKNFLLLNSKVLKPSSVEPVKQWPRGSSLAVEGLLSTGPTPSSFDILQYLESEEKKNLCNPYYDRRLKL